VSAIPPAYTPPIQWIENAAGVLLPYRPRVQFTGSAVSSVTDDPTNNRTVVDLTGGGGGGGPLTSQFTGFPGELGGGNFSNLPNVILDPAADWDDIGIPTAVLSGVSTAFLLPKGYYHARLTFMGQDDTPSPSTSILRYSPGILALAAGGNIPAIGNGPFGEFGGSNHGIMTVDDSGAGTSFAWNTSITFESGETDVGALFGLGTAYAILTCQCGIYDLTNDTDVSADGMGFANCWLYITQLGPKA
jgi:hypothetical protein